MQVLTLPNCLSLSRIALAPALAWALLNDAGAIAGALFLLVLVSDLLDGPLARHLRQSSPLGTLIDHGCDAVFVIAISAVCASLGLLPPVLPVLIALAFVQYLLDSRVSARTGPRRSRIGRWNGIAYFVVTGTAVFVHHYARDPAFIAIVRGLGWLLVATTLVSMAERAHVAFRTRGMR